MKRLKRRYLMVKVEADIPPSDRELIDAVWASVTKLYGDVGASSTGLSLISFDAVRQISVIRVWLGALPMARASLATLTSINGRPVALHVISVSGTIKSLWNRENFF